LDNEEENPGEKFGNWSEIIEDREKVKVPVNKSFNIP
jgi:hypothetical protein